MIRLKDIAACAGVSVMTVSKALRDKADVSAQTKTRIKLLAQQLGYVPDSSAQGLRSRSMRLFGLAVSSCADPSVATVVQSIEERAYEMGFDIILAQTADIPEREEACLRRFLARRVDGIFVAPAPSAAGRRIYEDLAARRIPTLVLGPCPPCCSRFPNVEVNDTEGARLAAKHLIGLGHTRIVFLAGPGDASWARSRLEGWAQALRDAGIEPQPDWIISAGRTVDDGSQAALKVLESGSRFTAVQAVNDFVAMGAARLLLQKGCEIPGRISLVGFGDVLMSEQWLLPLTTVSQPGHKFGTAAVIAMHRLLRGQSPDGLPLTPELIIRASTGTASAAL